MKVHGSWVPVSRFYSQDYFNSIVADLVGIENTGIKLLADVGHFAPTFFNMYSINGSHRVIWTTLCNLSEVCGLKLAVK